MKYKFCYIVAKWFASFFFVSIFFGCRDKYLCCLERNYEENNNRLISSIRVDSSLISMPHFDRLTAKYLPDFSFGIHHTYLFGRHFIIYLLRNRELLLLINPFDSLDTRKIEVGSVFDKHIPYNANIHGDILHCIGDEEYVYRQYRIGESLNEILSVNLKAVIGKNNDDYIYSSLVVDKSLAFKDNYLIIPYGSYSAKNNCGSKSWKIVNIFSKEIFTALDFPEKYRKCDLRNPDSIIELGDSTDVYAAFPKFDKVYKLNVTNGYVDNATKDSVFPNRFLCFDAGLNYNMAYKEKYEKLDENNENLIFNPNSKKVFLIKKLRIEVKNEASRCAILIFDKNLNQIGTYYTSAGLYPRLSYWYKDGIVITDSSFSKGHYYVFYK